eukprot:307907-Pelagomonas_calceolata.AAC.8
MANWEQAAVAHGQGASFPNPSPSSPSLLLGPGCFRHSYVYHLFARGDSNTFGCYPNRSLKKSQQGTAFERQNAVSGSTGGTHLLPCHALDTMPHTCCNATGLDALLQRRHALTAMPHTCPCSTLAAMP